MSSLCFTLSILSRDCLNLFTYLNDTLLSLFSFESPSWALLTSYINALMCIIRNSLFISGQLLAMSTINATDFLLPNCTISSLSYPLCTQYLTTCMVISWLPIPSLFIHRKHLTRWLAVHYDSSSDAPKSSNIFLNNVWCLYTLTLLVAERTSAS